MRGLPVDLKLSSPREFIRFQGLRYLPASWVRPTVRLHAARIDGRKTIIDDPIVEEVQRTRERMLAEYGGMDGLMREFRAIEDEMRDKVVRLKPRKRSRRHR